MSFTVRCREIALGLFLILLSGPAFAESSRLSFSTSVNYSVGDYGTNQNTSLLYVPFTIRVTPIEPLTLGLTVPYIRQSTQSIVLTGGGVATRQSQVRQTEEGLGDILLKGEYAFLEEQSALPGIAGSLKIKFPTADKNKGLGTGEFDETGGVSLSKTVIQGLVAYLDLAYTFVGSPPGTHFNNSFAWSVGAASLLTPSLTLFGFLDGATAISKGQENPLELRFGGEYKLTQVVRLTASASAGLSKGSADYGLSGGISFRF